MKKVVKMLDFISIFSAAIAAGGQVFVFMVILPLRRRWSPGKSVQLHREMLIELPDRYLRPLSIVSGIAAIITLLLQPNFKKLSTIFTLAGLASTVAVFITAKLVNFPINDMLLNLPDEAVPSNYPQIQERWNKGHTIRTASGVLALINYTLAALTR